AVGGLAALGDGPAGGVLPRHDVLALLVGETLARPGAQLERHLDAALAVRLRADHPGATVHLQGARDDLGGAGGAAVDEDDHGPRGAAVAGARALVRARGPDALAAALG